MDPSRRRGHVGDRRSFPGALPDDRLQRANVRLDFHQDGLASSIEPDIRRPTAHPRDGSLDGGMPAWVASAEDGFDDSSVRSIVDEWRASRIDRDPEVGAQHRPARARILAETSGPPCSIRQMTERSSLTERRDRSRVTYESAARRGPPVAARPPRPKSARCHPTER